METVQAGVPLLLAQTTSYALPPHVVHLQSTDAVELGVTTNAMTLTATSTTGLQTAACFVRCTTSTTCVVIVKRFN
jgi:hypothetical protein